MALKNIHLDSVVRGILDANKGTLQAAADVADAKVKELGLTGGKAVEEAAKHRRGPDKGKFKGSSNFNGRNLIGWIESIPAGDTDEVKQAHADLLTVHATLLSRGLKPQPIPGNDRDGGGAPLV